MLARAGAPALCPVCRKDTLVAGVWNQPRRSWTSHGPITPSDPHTGLLLMCGCQFFTPDAWRLTATRAHWAPTPAEPLHPTSREGHCPTCAAPAHGHATEPFCRACHERLPWTVCPWCARISLTRPAHAPTTPLTGLRFDCCAATAPAPHGGSSGWLPHHEPDPRGAARLCRAAHAGGFTIRTGERLHTEPEPILFPAAPEYPP